MGCMDRMNELEEEVVCITNHSASKTICLDKWVLEVAAIGLKTRKNKSYTVLRKKGLASEPEFLRSVAYRQFFCFIWDFTRNSTRLPLPCCVYHIIRETFPSDNGNYRGFIEDDENIIDEPNTDSGDLS
ncbi:uncharacterized protein LOC110249658 [Exaiptasia diaphana]|uniref:P2X purinoreceptor 7 intracellular domain-containing protein n=1 Tax=Exaiptasia diaphana TaxID=2652724 RepID=A0A913XXL4_EXADI|nr:uncharacterized protein LOC110249658 [Exaiptasia diaphana]